MIIFVAGGYGVGKTTVCEMLARELGCMAVSASALIRQRRGSLTWDQHKHTHGIVLNQQYLIESVSAFRAHGQTLVLDGHFALLDGEGMVAKIDKNVFYHLNLDAIILIEGDVKDIASRLSERDLIPWNYSLISALMVAERENALSFHKVSGVPLKIFDCNETQEILDYLRAFEAVSNDPGIKEH